MVRIHSEVFRFGSNLAVGKIPQGFLFKGVLSNWLARWAVNPVLNRLGGSNPLAPTVAVLLWPDGNKLQGLFLNGETPYSITKSKPYMVVVM